MEHTFAHQLVLLSVAIVAGIAHFVNTQFDTPQFTLASG
jgi:hypothetical protein